MDIDHPLVGLGIPTVYVSKNMENRIDRGSEESPIDCIDEDEYMDEDIEDNRVKEEVLAAFQDEQNTGITPRLSHLLIMLTHHDIRLKKSTFRQTNAFLERNPQISQLLKDCWKNRSFKGVRQLGVFCYFKLYPLLNHHLLDALLPQVSQSHKMTSTLKIRLGSELLTDDNLRILDNKVIDPIGRKGSPSAVTLLMYITYSDERLVTLDIPKATQKVDHNPGLSQLLDDCWKKKDFKEVRQLGVFHFFYFHIPLKSLSPRHSLARAKNDPGVR